MQPEGPPPPERTTDQRLLAEVELLGDTISLLADRVAGGQPERIFSAISQLANSHALAGKPKAAEPTSDTRDSHDRKPGEKCTCSWTKKSKPPSTTSDDWGPKRKTPAGGGNPPINQRQLQTQVAVQSGETVLLGGLIQESNTEGDQGLPGLVNIPIIGKLFGNTNKSRNRTELIVLITPRVIRNQEEARTMTEEYQNKFESLAPLRAKGTVLAPPTPTPSPDAPIKNTANPDKGFVPAETVPMPNTDKQH